MVRDMVDDEIAKKEDKVVIEDIFKLAFNCLNAKIKDRPDMKKVAQRLSLIIEQRRERQQGHKRMPFAYVNFYVYQLYIIYVIFVPK